MSTAASPEGRGYVIPRYRAEGAAFYHFLHGTVPGHQIDFMVCPEVPQGALRQTHVGHLARLIKYIEPRDGAPYAFAIGNLSRDDVQHHPGHGGVAVLFALRVPGVVDHAGRDMPPYAHGVVAVDRQLTGDTLLRTVMALHAHFLEQEGAEDRRGDFYRSYVHTMRESPADVASFLTNAIREFDGLPSPPRSTLGWDYVVDGAEPPRQIALLVDDPPEIGRIARWTSRIVALLYRSNIKWTSVSTGRELDIPGGTTLRFVPRCEARSAPQGLSFALDELPEDEEALAALLFGARRRGPAAGLPARGWREVLAHQHATNVGMGAEGDPNVDATGGLDRPCEPPSTHPTDGENLGEALAVDDAAATIPVAALLDAVRGEPLAAAAADRSSSTRLSASVVPVMEKLPGSQDEDAAKRPRVRASRTMIVLALAAATTVMAVTLALGLNIGRSPPPAGGAAAEQRPAMPPVAPIPSAPDTGGGPAESVEVKTPDAGKGSGPGRTAAHDGERGTAKSAPDERANASATSTGAPVSSSPVRGSQSALRPPEPPKPPRF